MTVLVLIRGLPGSGKSTIARNMRGFEHIEADMFFEQEGEYRFDPAKLNDAHRYCLERTRAALAQGKNVVVSNTFSRCLEMAPYFSLGVPVRVIEAKGQFVSIHAVGDDVINAMAAQWEALPLEWHDAI